jgi:uncharacterized protein (TIGR03905 family)
MGNYAFTPKDVCSKKIKFTLEDGKLYNISFMGGCPGNLSAISKLLEGADAKWTIERLKGNDCAGRGTSCADQLSIAIEKALEAEEAEEEQ